MILDKETFEKFGYWPKDIKPWSTKPVIRKCDRCLQIQSIQNRYNIKKRKNLCRVCAANKMTEHKRIEFDNIIANSVDKKITPKLWVELFRGASVVFSVRRPVVRPHIVANTLKIKSGGKSYYGVTETAWILKELGLSSKSANTLNLKMALKKYFKNESLLYRWNAMNKMVKESKSANSIINCSKYLYFDGAWQEFFSLAGISVRPHFAWRKGKCRYSVVECGSFFLDGRWIHIG